MADKPIAEDPKFDQELKDLRDLVAMDQSNPEWPEMPDVGGKKPSTVIRPPGSNDSADGEDDAESSTGEGVSSPVSPSPSFEILDEDRSSGLEGGEGVAEILQAIARGIYEMKDELPGDIARALKES